MSHDSLPLVTVTNLELLAHYIDPPDGMTPISQDEARKALEAVTKEIEILRDELADWREGPLPPSEREEMLAHISFLEECLDDAMKDALTADERERLRQP
jgi:hypothetical protein